MTWKLVYAKQAQKDAKKLASSGLKPKAQELLALIAEDPYRQPPPFEKLLLTPVWVKGACTHEPTR